MASRALASWRSLASARQFTTSTAPRMRPIAPTADDVLGHHPVLKPKPRGEFVPVYVALGLILLSASFGIHTAQQQLRHSPNVLVSKKKRETVPEVVDPEWAAAEAERFISGSVFRRVAHLQDFDAVWATRGHVIDRPRKLETLKSVGVDPSRIE
ncbi:unnamed protein product [Musa hybrid cultivar]